MKIVIIDDDRLVAISLKNILETDSDIQIAAMGYDADTAVSLYREYLPDILLMDIRMQNKTGLEAGETILKDNPNAKILFLTTFSDDEYIVKALNMGAKGYLLKQDFESIAPALHAVYSGQTVFGGEIGTKIPNLIKSGENFSYSDYGLTEKEANLLQLIAQGLNNKEIAEQLFLGEGTVRNYLSCILDKLQLRDRTQLAIFYYQHLSQ